MKNQPVTAMPNRASAGWQTMDTRQLSLYTSQLKLYNNIRAELEQVPQEHRPAWLEGFLKLLMGQFKPKEVIKAA